VFPNTLYIRGYSGHQTALALTDVLTCMQYADVRFLMCSWYNYTSVFDMSALALGFSLSQLLKRKIVI